MSYLQNNNAKEIKNTIKLLFKTKQLIICITFYKSMQSCFAKIKRKLYHRLAHELRGCYLFVPQLSISIKALLIEWGLSRGLGSEEGGSEQGGLEEGAQKREA